MSWSVLLSQLALLNYAVAALLFFRGRGSKGSSGLQGIATGLFVFATLVLLIQLTLTLFSVELEVIEQRWQFVAALLGTICIGLEPWLPLAVSACFVSPINFLILIAGSGSHFSSPSSFIEFHVAGAVMGLLLAVLAGVLSALYLWQEHLLKNRQMSRLYSSTPALDVIDRALSACLWCGFCFISAALVSGTLTSVLSEGDGHMLSPKAYLSYGVWIWYLAILIGRGRTRISGPRMAQMSLLGLMILSIIFFGLSF